jgi:hypothetical protein
MEKIFRISQRDMFEAAKIALRALQMQIQYDDIKEGVIEANTSTSWLSWGEDIQIRIIKKASGTLVRVKSTSKAQLLSWGTNSKNEEKIIQEITQIVKNK